MTTHPSKRELYPHVSINSNIVHNSNEAYLNLFHLKCSFAWVSVVWIHFCNVKLIWLEYYSGPSLWPYFVEWEPLQLEIWILKGNLSFSNKSVRFIHLRYFNTLGVITFALVLLFFVFLFFTRFSYRTGILNVGGPSCFDLPTFALKGKLSSHIQWSWHVLYVCCL